MPANRQQSQRNPLTSGNSCQRDVSKRQQCRQNLHMPLTALTFADARQQLVRPAQRIVLTLLTAGRLSARQPGICVPP